MKTGDKVFRTTLGPRSFVQPRKKSPQPRSTNSVTSRGSLPKDQASNYRRGLWSSLAEVPAVSLFQGVIGNRVGFCSSPVDGERWWNSARAKLATISNQGTAQRTSGERFAVVGFPDKPRALVIEMDQNNETNKLATVRDTRPKVSRLRRRARRARARASLRVKSNLRSSALEVAAARN